MGPAFAPIKARPAQHARPAAAIGGRATALERSLQALHRWNRAQMATIPGARVLATAGGPEKVAILRDLGA